MPPETSAAPCPWEEIPDPVLRSGAAELGRRIAAGEITAEAAMAARLQRIEAVEGRIHAFVDMDPDRALAAAREADAALASGVRPGPLLGVPVTVKDWIEAEGLVCEGGFSDRRGRRPRRDATAVARLRAAGAIVLGKTVVGSGPPDGPPPANPYDLVRSPGASSSGEAAALASGASCLGLASDSGGSIRLPAAWCGLVGLKPTTGRVPVTGHFPPVGALSDPRTVIGPMARRVEDLALALGIIAGPDGADPAAQPTPLREARALAVAGLRVALVDWASAGVDPEVVAATHAMAGRLERLGAQIEARELPVLDSALEATRIHWRRRASLSLRNWVPAGPATLDADTVDRGTFLWERLQRELLAFMESLDLILCPAVLGPAPRRRPLAAEDFLLTLPFSLTGDPVLSFPAGRTREGLPIGVQLVARRWREDVALAAGEALEAEAADP